MRPQWREREPKERLTKCGACAMQAKINNIRKSPRWGVQRASLHFAGKGNNRRRNVPGIARVCGVWWWRDPVPDSKSQGRKTCLAEPSPPPPQPQARFQVHVRRIVRIASLIEIFIQTLRAPCGVLWKPDSSNPT